MEDSDRRALYRIVRNRLNSGRAGCKPKQVERAIFDAHNGRPDGFLVTTENMWLFRQYRNGVSPSPQRLVTEALEFCEEEVWP